MKLSILALACLLVITPGKQNSRRDSEPVIALRQRCFTAIQQTPRSATEICRRYLERSAEDDERPAKFVRQWFVAYDQVQPYIQALSALAHDHNRSWLVYEPDLRLDIPQIAEKDSNYSVELDRSFNGPVEDALLKKAEAVYQSPNKMAEIVLRDPRWLAEHVPEDNEPLWWVAGNDNVRLTTVVTARAVRHYYDLSLKLRQNPDAVPGFTMNHTSLVYHANIKRYSKYSHGEDRFSDVYVADLNLVWSHGCGGLCGMSFERNKLVVLGANGDVLAMFLDAPVNSRITVS